VCIREFTLAFGRVGLELEDEEGVGLGRVGLELEDEEGVFPVSLVFRDLVGAELEDVEPSLVGFVQTELGFLITVSKGQ
jgi:hypothetical protein